MKSKTFYIASCAPEGGIHSYVYEDSHVVETGFFPVANANYIAFSPDKQFLFTSIAANGAGDIASFKINPDDHVAYKQFGNSVNVEVVKLFAKYLFGDKETRERYSEKSYQKQIEYDCSPTIR